MTIYSRFNNPELIKQILPHREPFLLVDQILTFESGKKLTASLNLAADAWFFKGHFPKQPIMPGVLITEALAQTSGILLELNRTQSKPALKQSKEQYVLGKVSMKYLTTACPGDTLILHSNLLKNIGSLFMFETFAMVAEKIIAKGTLSLAMALTP